MSNSSNFQFFKLLFNVLNFFSKQNEIFHVLGHGGTTW